MDIEKGIGHGCDKKAARVVKMMPDWDPLKDSATGKTATTKLKIPIKFKLK